MPGRCGECSEQARLLSNSDGSEGNPPVMNTLYYGNNLPILRDYLDDETVDLVYLDPPFNSNANYNVLFAEKDGSQAASQIKAFDDTWHWTNESERQYHETVEAGGKVSQALQAFRQLLGTNDMLAYLTMMAPRLVEPPSHTCSIAL